MWRSASRPPSDATRRRRARLFSSSRCSQLSSTTTSWRSARNCTSASSVATPAGARRASMTARTTSAPSRTGAKGTNQQPSGKSGAIVAATASGEPAVADLEDALGGEQVAEAVLSEVAQSLRDFVGDGRAEDLPAVGDGHQAGGAVDSWAEVVAVALHRLTGVDTHPHPQHGRTRPRGVGQRGLGMNGGAHGVVGAMKGGREHVAAGGEDMTVVLHDGATNDPVMQLEGGPHRRPGRLSESRRPLDVSEQERHRARRQPHHKPEFRTPGAAPVALRVCVAWRAPAESVERASR